MNRIQKTFAKGPAFVAYLTAGDGGMQRTLDAALALIAGGVNILEIGVPFSDPVADGPTIQRAATRALASGTTLNDVLWLARSLREKTDIPLILFSYFNPIFIALKQNFLADAKQAGIDGILIVDCPLEEAREFHQQCHQHHIAPINVITPTTPTTRITKIDKKSKGFLYYACRKGTTGVRNSLPEGFAEKMQEIKTASHLPVVVGFGISNHEMATEVLRHADGFVVGSLFVKALEEGATDNELTTMAKILVAADTMQINSGVEKTNVA